MLGTGTFFQDSDEVPDASLLLLAAARLRDQAKEVAEEQQWREQVAEWLRLLEL